MTWTYHLPVQTAGPPHCEIEYNPFVIYCHTTRHQIMNFCPTRDQCIAMASLMITKPLPTLIHLSLAPCFLPVIVPALNLASASCQVKGTMGRKEEDTEMVERAVTHRPLSGCNPTIPEHLHVYTNTRSGTICLKYMVSCFLGAKRSF